MFPVLLAASSTASPSAAPGEGPSWTDTGGFIVALIGLALSIAVAIVGWWQVKGAKEDARTAKAQADAAKVLAGEAEKQTAAAEAAVAAARAQVDIARDQVAEFKRQTEEAQRRNRLEAEPALAVTVRAKEHRTFDGVHWEPIWQVTNHGRAWARDVALFIDWAERPYPIFLGDIAPSERAVIPRSAGLPDPASIDDSEPGKLSPPWIETRIKWETLDGKSRTSVAKIRRWMEGQWH